MFIEIFVFAHFAFVSYQVEANQVNGPLSLENVVYFDDTDDEATSTTAETGTTMATEIETTQAIMADRETEDQQTTTEADLIPDVSAKIEADEYTTALPATTDDAILIKADIDNADNESAGDDTTETNNTAEMTYDDNYTDDLPGYGSTESESKDLCRER